MNSNLLRTNGERIRNSTGTRGSKFETRRFETRPQFRFSNFGLQFLSRRRGLPLPCRATEWGSRKRPSRQQDYLADYIERVKAVKPPTPTTGSFWTLAESLFGHGE